MANNNTLQNPEASVEKQDSYFSIEHLQADLGGRAARGGAVALVSNGLRFIVTIAATSVMARLLSPEDYGLIGMVAIFINFVSMFRDMGLSVATIQKDKINYDQVSTLFWFNFALSVAVMIFISAMAPAVSWFYGEPRLIRITIASALGIVLGGLAVQHEALLRRQMKFLALAVIAFLSMVAGYVVGIIMAWRGFGYWALVSSQLGLALTNTLGVWLACRWRPGLPKRNSGVRSMVAFGRDFTGFSVINYFSRNLDNLLIGRVWGARQLGLYNRAYQLMTLPIDQINEPIASVAIPALSRLTDSPERYRQGYLRMLEKIALLTMPGVALMIATADWIVHLLLGSQWAGTTPIFILLGITALFQPIANTTGWLFLSQGRGRQMLKWGFISGPLVMGSIVAGLPWGALGVAASYTITGILIVDPLLFWFVGRTGPVRTMDFYRTMAPFVCASLISLLACVSFRQLELTSKPVIGVGICLIITIVTSLLVLAVLPGGRRALQDIPRLVLVLSRKNEGDMVI
jgi:PST family polysaccharide transporter